MGSTPAGNELINAIQNESVLSADSFTRLRSALDEDDVASNFQACILGTYSLSPRDIQFVKDGFSLPVSALQSVLDNLAGGVQSAPAFPNFLPNITPNAFPNAFFNTSPVNVSMPAGFGFAVQFTGPALQQWDVLTFPAGSAFASTGPGKYFELFTGANTNQYYVWYNVTGGSNTDPAPAGFTGIEVTIGALDSAATVATKTNTAFAASVAPVSLLGVAATYAALAYSAVTGSTVGSGSTITGNIGIYPTAGTFITNFPPSTFTGEEDTPTLNVPKAQVAQAAAQAAYTSLQGMTPTGTSGGHINSELGGQSLAAGVYVATSGTAGTFTLNGTLTLTGSATDVYVFQTASTLITGGTLTPVISLGSVLPGNIYWVVGSSATINDSFPGTFQGNVIAQASIGETLGGTINGSMIALTGAVVFTGEGAVNVTSSGPGSPGMDDAASFVNGNAVTVVLAPFTAAVARPFFSLIDGTYHGTQTVTISSGTPGTAFYYTTDGSIPTVASTLYSGPISVAASRTIRVLGTLDDFANSAIASATYVIT
jgi:hypothetical protein